MGLSVGEGVRCRGGGGGVVGGGVVVGASVNGVAWWEDPGGVPCWRIRRMVVGSG